LGCAAAQELFDAKEQEAAEARRVAEVASKLAKLKHDSLSAQRMAAKLSQKATKLCREALAAHQLLCIPTFAPSALPTAAPTATPTATPTARSIATAMTWAPIPTPPELSWIDKAVSDKVPCNREWVKIAQQQVYSIGKQLLLARIKLSTLVKQEAVAARASRQLNRKVSREHCEA
jgi:hypothetical protein